MAGSPLKLRPRLQTLNKEENNGVDQHTLFDLDLMGISPETYRIKMSPGAESAGYSEFSGKQCYIRVEVRKT